MFLLAILNRLKSFLMFAINWIHWKVKLLQQVNMPFQQAAMSFMF